MAYRLKILLIIALSFMPIAALPLVAGAQVEQPFTLESETFNNGDVVPNSMLLNDLGCTGSNDSPQLTWTNAPAATQSFVITMMDPDTQNPNGWWHWGVYNIPANVTTFKAGISGNPSDRMTIASEAINDYKKVGYGGVCPPEGDKPHRYIITVYALSIPKIEFKGDNINASALTSFIRKYTIAVATLEGKYSR